MANTPTLKITKLSRAPKIGDQLNGVFNPTNPGSMGKVVENTFKNNGYDINQGAGPDLEKMGVEIKSRNIRSTSAHSIGRMNTNDIVSTAWDTTHIRDKCQQQHRVEYDPDTSIVTQSKIYDLTDDYIQSQLEDGYNDIRNTIANGTTDTYLRSGIVVAERASEKSDSWQLRISNSGMKRIKDYSESAKIKNNIFVF